MTTRSKSRVRLLVFIPIFFVSLAVAQTPLDRIAVPSVREATAAFRGAPAGADRSRAAMSLGRLA